MFIILPVIPPSAVFEMGGRDWSKPQSKQEREKTMKTLMRVAAAAALLSGCVGSTTVVGHKYPAVPVGSVQLLYQEPKRPYEVIAFVGRLRRVEHISADIAGLQEEAAQVGADAVIVTSAKDMTLWEYSKASGKAIKWTGTDERNY